MSLTPEEAQAVAALLPPEEAERLGEASLYLRHRSSLPELVLAWVLAVGSWVAGTRFAGEVSLRHWLEAPSGEILRQLEDLRLGPRP